MKKAHELLTDESKWTKGALARTIDEWPVSADSPDATCWCLEGALRKVYGETPGVFLLKDFVTKANALVSFDRPCDWNDADGRTFSEVRDLLLKLDI